MARRLGGRFLLRIEDIDQTRSRPEYIEAIYDDLHWLGISWEEPVLCQSEHFPEYARAAQKLADLGLLYPCFASRGEILAAADHGKLDPEGGLIYPGLWRGRSLADIDAARGRDLPYALRLDMARALRLASDKLGGKPLTFMDYDTGGRPRTVVADPERWGDIVILRKEVPASYLIAVVIDDARQGVTHVTRGTDLFAATDAQRLLQVLLDLPELLYHHHRLILDENGRKLSKSANDTGLAALRSSGASPDDIRCMVGLVPQS